MRDMDLGLVIVGCTLTYITSYVLIKIIAYKKICLTERYVKESNEWLERNKS